MGNQPSKRPGSKGQQTPDLNVHPLTNSSSSSSSSSVTKDKTKSSSKSKDNGNDKDKITHDNTTTAQHNNSSNISDNSIDSSSTSHRNSSSGSSSGSSIGSGNGNSNSRVSLENDKSVGTTNTRSIEQQHDQEQLSRQSLRESNRGSSSSIVSPSSPIQKGRASANSGCEHPQEGEGSTPAAVTIVTEATSPADEESPHTGPPQLTTDNNTNAINTGAVSSFSASCTTEAGVGSNAAVQSSEENSQQAQAHPLDATSQTTNGHQQNSNNGSSQTLQGEQPGESRNDTQPQQPSPSSMPVPIPVPSIPFAVSTPGNPILVKKHTTIAPLAIIQSPSSPHFNRSPPPAVPSPKSGSFKKTSDFSPTGRISFLGSSPGDKGNSKGGGIDIDDMISRLLDAGYSGKISKNVCLKNSEILMICQMAGEIFLSQPTLIELNAPVKIVGDIHGQYTDLLRLFEMCGFPPSANFLFLGDYVDRGKMSLETILLLFCYKIKYPENFFLLRGNHECANVTRVYGFYDECKRRASIKMWKTFVDTFNCLPLAAIVANKIFCVHGGLSPSLVSMDDIRAIRRPTDVPDYGLLNDLLWSDPSDTALDWEDNERGVSYCFGRSIIQKFLNKHDFDLVCRAHMVVEDGYEFFNDRTLVTVFSAPNYCGEFDNYGAVMSVNEDLLCSFELLKPIDPITAKAHMQSLAASTGGWRVNKQRLSFPDGNALYGAPQGNVASS
ncbi:hypothetical protein BGZ65_004252 [Modicella reniformis]|uniref:Serine/threonine-protein phosphatase n=1 Tax=Modicella reniformis TaxID=1440133 RepID=A0A9P6M905_9FUNG|nr:hypothetical protein BGZ65_004252 [Modicella reniformis]